MRRGPGSSYNEAMHAYYHDVPADEQFYRRVKAEIGDDKPKGLIVHLVVAQASGLRHIEVWESERDCERFHLQRAEPALERVFAAAGITPRPPEPPRHDMHVVDVWT
jgi:hypothetical protein